MSGTSMDGVDAALVRIDDTGIELVDFVTLPYPDALKHNAELLCHPSSDELNLTLEADQLIADIFANAANELLTRQQLAPDAITAIGSHGQTLRHAPDTSIPYTLQIGDPNRIAVKTGIDTVADFRRKDIALGGQGAPLVPVPHWALFGQRAEPRVLVNIGGIANVSFLPARDGSSDALVGFDTGPGNTLMDLWCQKHLGEPYDKDGDWASQGKANPRLLKHCLADAYFAQPYPKSTGRDYFHMAWLQDQLAKCRQDVAPVDVQATLLELTAVTITSALKQLPETQQCYICGGGAYNNQLMTRLHQLHNEVDSTNALGLSPDAIEAVCFAWLAYAHVNRIPGNLPSVTGASKQAILGALYPST